MTYYCTQCGEVSELKTLRAEVEAMQSELDKYIELLPLAQAVVDDTPHLKGRKPSPTDCYGINGVKLWKLAKRLGEKT